MATCSQSRPQDGKGYVASRVVLATGGRSLPKTGSDGFGYELARRLGHGYVETTPALAPLVLDGDRHVSLSGVSHRVLLTLRADDRVRVRLEGPLLWTHFGASGPAVLNMSRHWHRARLDGQAMQVAVNVCPDDTFESLERWFLDQERERPRAQVSTVLAGRLPAAVADVWIASAHVEPIITLAHLTREERRRLIHALLETGLDVRDSRGYAYAEVTAGGIPLDGSRFQRRWSRASVQGCIWSVRSSTSTEGSAASTSSGLGVWLGSGERRCAFPLAILPTRLRWIQLPTPKATRHRGVNVALGVGSWLGA
jgi:predicted Rossmann fold flavoprotein